MPRRYYLLLTLITLAAAFLRLWQLTAVPPGLHYDLAATALLGSEVAFNGYNPIFISAYTGHEALFYYWLALWFRLAGSSVFTLRLAAAMLGVLAVPAGFFALREALRFEGELALPLAALGAALLAISFFQVVFSRFGFRAISEPTAVYWSEFRFACVTMPIGRCSSSTTTTRSCARLRMIPCTSRSVAFGETESGVS